MGTLPHRLQFPPVVYKNSDLKARLGTHEVHTVPGKPCFHRCRMPVNVQTGFEDHHSTI